MDVRAAASAVAAGRAAYGGRPVVDGGVDLGRADLGHGEDEVGRPEIALGLADVVDREDRGGVVVLDRAGARATSQPDGRVGRVGEVDAESLVVLVDGAAVEH